MPSVGGFFMSDGRRWGLGVPEAALLEAEGAIVCSRYIREQTR